MKQDGYWARTDRERADTFAEYLFIPNIRDVGPGEEETVFGCREHGDQYGVKRLK